MNVGEMIEMAQIHKRMPIELNYGITWINEAIDLLATKYDTACVSRTAPTVVTVDDIDMEHYLIPDFKGIKKILDANNKLFQYYTATHDGVTFQQVGIYSIYFYDKPPKVGLLNGKNDIPTIHSDYHYIIPLFVASRELTEVDQLSQLANIKMQEFLARAEEINERLSAPSRRHNRIPNRMWR